MYTIDLLLTLILAIFFGALFGALVGLIPFFVGKYSGKPNLGKYGWKWCTGVGVAAGVLAIPMAIAFVIAIIVRDHDRYVSAPAPVMNPAPVPVQAPPVEVNTHLGVSCLSGPLKGQTYRIGPNGIIIGRDHDCTVRFASDAPGISRHHCALRWQQGVLMLTDMNSAYGTFLADGRKLPPQYPTQMAAGSRFYLANSGYLFQIVITG